MTTAIRFERHHQSLAFHSPLLGGALDRQELELRRDPLTGHQSVMNPRLADKVAMFFAPSDLALIERIVRESEPRCFLCGDRWQQTTPSYPADVLPSGRLVVGEAVLTPNLFPVSQLHAVVRLGKDHHRPLAAFTPGIFRDALDASVSFLRHHHRALPQVCHATIDGNFLHPGGASLAHPHVQILGGDVPCGWVERILGLGRSWLGAHGRCYWTELLATERELGDRFIADAGPVGWLASFSPDGTNEVIGILPERRHFLELGENDIAGLAEGLAAVLRGYGAMGLSTYNLTVYSGPLGAGDEGFRCLARVISRQNFYENYRADDYFLQKLLRTELILTPPEQLATTLRRSFNGSPTELASSRAAR